MLSNFESSPLRFEYEAHLEEYRSLRAQIVMLTESQMQIINYSIAAIGATGISVQFFLQSESEIVRQTTPFLLLRAALVFYLTLEMLKKAQPSG